MSGQTWPLLTTATTLPQPGQLPAMSRSGLWAKSLLMFPSFRIAARPYCSWSSGICSSFLYLRQEPLGRRQEQRGQQEAIFQRHKGIIPQEISRYAAKDAGSLLV